MNKDELIDFIKLGYSISTISKKLNKSKTSVRYWLHKYNLKTKLAVEKRIETSTKVCSCCKIEYDKSHFYDVLSRKNNSKYSYCKKCADIKTLERQRETKLKALEYKGGECVKCGYKKYIGALHFHHLNPEEKDKQWNNFKLRKFDENFKKELDKCVILCANCHAEEHSIL